MIQSVKLDSPTLSRESSQGDSGGSGFSSMLANLVKPETSLSKAQTTSPQAQVQPSVHREKTREAPKADVSRRENSQETSRNDVSPRVKPQETHKTEASHTNERPQASDKEQTTQSTSEKSTSSTEQKPPTRPSRPRGTENQPAEKAAEKTQDQAEPAAQSAPELQAAIAQLPVAPPKPLDTIEAPQTEAPPAAPLATALPPPEAAPTQNKPVSDQKTDPAEGQPSVNPAAANAIPPEAIPLVPLPAAQVPAQVAASEPESAGDETKISADKAPTQLAVPPQALPDLKAALKPQIQVKGTPDKTEADSQELLVKKDSSSVSTEITKDSAKNTAKANSTQDVPTTQTAEAALGLKAPSPKPALTELLSRPGPIMETPSVVTTIQEARNTNSTQWTAPVATALPGTESSRGSAFFQGREFQSGQGTQTQTQPSSTGNISAAFTLDAPVAAQAKVAVPEVAATRPSLPMEQMEGTIRWALKNQQNTAELQLRPESLGKVQIQLKVEGNQVHAKIWASEPSTVPLLESHRGMLESSLREQGLSLGSFDLHQGQGAFRHPTEQTSGQASFAGPVLDLSKESIPEIPVPSASGLFGTRRVEVFA